MIADDVIMKNIESRMGDNNFCIVMGEKYMESANNEHTMDTDKCADDKVLKNIVYNNDCCIVLRGTANNGITNTTTGTNDKGKCEDEIITRNIISVIDGKGGCIVMGGKYKEFFNDADTNDMSDKGICADDEIMKNVNPVMSNNVNVQGSCQQLEFQ